jgi:hypothetical protein
MAATTLQVVVLSLSTACEGWSGSHPERRGDRRGGIEEGEGRTDSSRAICFSQCSKITQPYRQTPLFIHRKIIVSGSK